MLTISRYPDPVLRERCAPVAVIDDALRELAEGMLEAMYAAHGVGLAAPQVGITQRLFVMDVNLEVAEPHVLINPIIIERSSEKEPDEEGCLSIPKVKAQVTRPASVTVEAQDLSGQVLTFAGDGLFARCMQHEIDHLDGILFIDKISQSARLTLSDELEYLEDSFARLST